MKDTVALFVVISARFLPSLCTSRGCTRLLPTTFPMYADNALTSLCTCTFLFFYLKIKAAFDGIIALTQKYVGGGAIARPIHDEDDELTPAWLTTALNERGNLPVGVTVTSLNFLNLGEGRGYAGKYVRWLIDDSST